MKVEIKQENAPRLLDAGILREYDIRGVVGDTLTERDCYLVGRAFGTVVARGGGRKVCLGFDGRASSPVFAQHLSRGLQDCGLHVENVGLGPTPMVYFALKTRDADAGVMITGSHSPLSYNGIKMALKSGPFYGPMVQELGEIVKNGKFAEGHGQETSADVQDAYADRLAADYTALHGLNVAWDNGNGAAGDILRRLTAKLPGTHRLLHGDIDGSFPNHHPDPTVAENLADLQACVRENGCDLGVAFDGDGDRVGAIDEQGNILWADVLMALYAADVLATHPAATVIADVKCSRVLFDEIARLGGTPVMWNTGHSLIKAKMAQTQAPLAGELAGHICFADKYYGYDDGPYAAVRLLDLVARAGKPLSALTAHLPRMHNTPEVRFPVPADRKFRIAPEIRARLLKENKPETSINDIDGVRVTTEDGWWLIRPSNTEDLLVLRAESFSASGLETLKAQLKAQLAASGVDFNFQQKGI